MRILVIVVVAVAPPRVAAVVIRPLSPLTVSRRCCQRLMEGAKPIFVAQLLQASGE